MFFWIETGLCCLYKIQDPLVENIDQIKLVVLETLYFQWLLILQLLRNWLLYIWCAISCWFILWFVVLKFQIKITSFCWIIAIYTEVHFLSGHSVEHSGVNYGVASRRVPNMCIATKNVCFLSPKAPKLLSFLQQTFRCVSTFFFRLLTLDVDARRRAMQWPVEMDRNKCSR